MEETGRRKTHKDGSKRLINIVGKEMERDAIYGTGLRTSIGD